jgi:hypothetical protein
VAHRKLAIFRRGLFTALSVLSLLLCVATLALWVRSFHRLDRMTYLERGALSIDVQSIRGQIEVVHGLSSPSSTPDGLSYDSLSSTDFKSSREVIRDSPSGYDFPNVSLLGFGYMYIESGATWWAWFPHWFLSLLVAILPALHLRAVIRSRRLHRAGHSPRCGYDLRATPARCPECGSIQMQPQRRRGAETG